MTVWAPEKWEDAISKAMSDILRSPYNGTPNTHPEEAALIIKVPVTDYLDGVVGQRLSPGLQVKVLDKQWKPVKGAPVLFSVKAGGATLGDKYEASITALTDRNGLASVVLNLGQKTAANPIYSFATGNTYSDQHGANIIDATLANGQAIATPFTAYGKPDKLDHLRQTHGSNTSGLIHSFAGFVALLAEDRFGNPIANKQVTFTFGPQQNISKCSKSSQDVTPAYLVKTNDPCLNQAPTSTEIGKCKSATQTLSEVTSSFGAAAEVVLGGSPETIYPVIAQSKVNSTVILNETFNLQTYPFGVCDSTTDPEYALIATYVWPSDLFGHTINAGKSGTVLTVQAKQYLLKELSSKITTSLQCGESTMDCPQIVGARTFTTVTKLEPSSMRFDTIAGSKVAGVDGLYQANYTLKPGLNTIKVSGHADISITRSANNCSNGCKELTETKGLDAVTYLQVYGVDISIKKPLQIMLDAAGYSRNNLKISYMISPADYQAFSAFILLYKGSELIDSISVETKASGFGTIARGYRFDETASYSVQVVLNYGTGVEIRSDKAPLIFAKGALIPDYNHNRKIDQEDYDRALNNDTYYFWVNDDDGKDDTEGSGIPGTRILTNESLSGTIPGTRDIIDWFPVFLDISNVLQKYPASSYSYYLSNESEKLRYVTTDLTKSDSGRYLTDISTSTSIINNQWIKAIDSYWTLPVDQNFLQKISTDSGIVLLEATGRNQKPLKLEVFNQTKQKVFETSLNLSIDGIEQMFRHKNLVQEGGGPAPAATEVDRLVEPLNFKDSEVSNKNFVFVHGYNVNPQAARGTHAEIFKRMYWSGSKAKFWGVTWYGYDTQIGPFTPDYHVNVTHALVTAPYLRSFLNSNVQGELTIAAHSLGNMVVSAMLSDNAASWDNNYLTTIPGAKIKNYFMIDAAVAIEAYDGGAAQSDDMKHSDWFNIYKEELWASEWHLLYLTDIPKDNRAYLTWRGRFTARPQFTNYYNFYSTGEEVLARLPINTPLTQIIVDEAHQLGIYAWAIQEKLKGGNPIPVDIAGSSLAGWGFNLDDYASGQWKDLPIPASLANLLTREEIKQKPFFKKGVDVDLYAPGSIGSTYAANNMNRLLGSAIPALTLPAGANKLNSIDPDNNFNMELEFKNAKKDWPQIRPVKNWRHSDLKNVSYPFVFKLFDTFVSSGELK